MKLRNAHTYTLVVCICVSVCVCEVENCLGKESQRAGRGFPCGGRVHFLARELPHAVGEAKKEKVSSSTRTVGTGNSVAGMAQ